ncbi:hypothetical protein LINPERPRIM_LOCUS21794 [Linum perenne]
MKYCLRRRVRRMEYERKV